MFHKVQAVQPCEEYYLLVWFDDGSIKEYDLTPAMRTWKQFKALKDRTLFKKVHVDAGGYGISWNDKLDLAGNELYDNGRNVDPCATAKKLILDSVAATRKEQGMSQAQLGRASGVQQPAVARLEKGESSPQLDTLLKVLAPLGKTLAVVDIA